MFGNIANNPAMRSRVLDDRLLERFEGICETKMYSLHLAVARALYCLSCSAENIPKLVQQRIVPMIRSLAQTQYTESRADLLSHLIATCYNLSTVVDIQHKLVSQGFVGVMLTLWPDAKQDKDLCLLSYLSICHLACGRTNTTQMAQDGCTSILCFISEYRKNPNLGNYNFTVDVHYRCSSALRNLLSVVSNQKAMVDQGCLASIIDLANFSSKDKDKAFNGDPQSNFTGIWRNCAVSLTSLTYNVEVREQLVKSEAINLILRNADEDRGEFNLSHGLLRELEAESWHNGARGKHKEGRSKILKPSTLYTELLRGGTTVHLDVVVQDAELDKFCVQVQLDEPQAHTDTDLSDPAATAPDEAAEARDKELQLDVLQPYVDLDDGFSSLAYTVEKQECALNTDSAFALYRGEDGLDEFESTTLTEDILAEPSAALPIPNNNLPGPHLDDGMGMGMGSPSEKSTLPQMGALGQLFFNNVKTVLAVMPPKESSDPFPPLVSPVKAKREVTRSPSVGKLQSAKQSPKNEQFKAIIGMIKEAKEGKSSMDDGKKLSKGVKSTILRYCLLVYYGYKDAYLVDCCSLEVDETVAFIASIECEFKLQNNDIINRTSVVDVTASGYSLCSREDAAQYLGALDRTGNSSSLSMVNLIKVFIVADIVVQGESLLETELLSLSVPQSLLEQHDFEGSFRSAVSGIMGRLLAQSANPHILASNILLKEELVMVSSIVL
ncbi:hypothetical protein B484DRAFT_418171 [Ochromonadaceae sp. CCMP2298]|nr:hypothetical protein B484DRAFT_418171 [Ochromonadaceae sp. CCMP2298]